MSTAVIVSMKDGAVDTVLKVSDADNQVVAEAAEKLFARECIRMGIDPSIEELSQFLDDGHAEWNDRAVFLTWPVNWKLSDDFNDLEDPADQKSLRILLDHLNTL